MNSGRDWLAVAALSCVLFLSSLQSTRAGLIAVPNASFETPSTFYVSVNIDSWQKSTKPDWYVEGGGIEWSQLVGIFANPASGQPDRIDNCDGKQATWLFAVPEVSLSQDYDSLPTHAFNATFQPGRAYRLTVGLLVGTGAGGAMQEGVTLGLNLYYRDNASNRFAVASASVTNNPSVFSNSTHLLDFSLATAVVQPNDPWAGKHLGIEFVSTVSSNMQGGYWDLDNVRLQEILPPVLKESHAISEGFQFVLQSEPGLRFEILATTNLWQPQTPWSIVGILTNTSGEATFTDHEIKSAAQYFRARWLP